MLRQGKLSMLVALLLTIYTAVAAAAPFAYISNSGSGTLSVIDTEKNEVTATIALPGAAPWAVAINGKRLYVTNLGNGNLYVVNTESNSVVTTVPIGLQPIGVAVNPAGTRVYVTNHLTSGFNGSLTIVDADVVNDKYTVITKFIIGRLPVGVAVHPSGNPVYVALSNGVAVHDQVTGNIGTIAAGSRPFGLALSPSGRDLYVSNQMSNSVTVIDTESGMAAGEVTVGRAPQGIAVSPDGSRVYVANREDNSVSVIRTAPKFELADEILVGARPYGLQMGADGRVYVANTGSNNVSVINPSDNNSVVNLGVGATPIGFGQTILPASQTDTTLTLDVDPDAVIIRSSSQVMLRATLTRRDTGAPLAGASIAFSKDSVALGSPKTDASGNAAWAVNPTTFVAGLHSFKAAFTESVINGMTFRASNANASLHVMYQWSGWLPPVAGDGALNPANAGSTIPVRFQLKDANGNPISSLAAIKQVQTAQIPCAGDGISDLSDAAATGGTALRYDGSHFHFNWKTDKAWAPPPPQCRAIIVNTADGAVYMAKFYFR